MPTIDQLAPATAATDNDELIISQNGVTRSITRALLLAGLQPQIAAPADTLLGNPTVSTGGAAPITVGANLSLAGGTLSATATPYLVSALPAGTVPAATDAVPLGQNGTNTSVTYGQFMSGLSGVANIDGSRLTVTPTGSPATLKLADLAASTALTSGATMTGSLVLAADPVQPLQAATKEYVDAASAGTLAKAGGTLIGPLTLAANPTLPFQAATKLYVDGQASALLPKAGGVLSGALTLAADPSLPLQAATKEYVDTRVQRAGDVMTGPLTLAADPMQPLQAATKEYVDAQSGGKLSTAGGALTGALTLAADPTQPLHAATKEYVDAQSGGKLSTAGGALTGTLTLAADPTQPLQAATKEYVDGRVQRTGDVMTGALTLAADPVQPLHAATKDYVDASSTAVSIVTATGASAARSLANRFADAFNVKDYGAKGDNTVDDAIGIRACIGSNRVVVIPAGNYYLKSQVVQPGPINYQPTPCLLFNGVQNCQIIAYGANFYIDNSITVPNPAYLNCGNAHAGFMNDCKNIVWSGGRFYGNRTLAGTTYPAVNTGMWHQSCTNITWQDMEFLGDYTVAPIFGGVYGFELTFRNILSHGSGNGFDFSYQENLTLIGNRFYGGGGANLASTGFKCFTDPGTVGFNTATNADGSPRTLRGNQSNNITLTASNLFSGWTTSVYLDGIDTARVTDSTLRDGKAAPLPNAAGVAVVTSDATNAQGNVTRDIVIEGNDIVQNGGPALTLGTGGHGLMGIVFARNRAYDNVCPYAIYPVNQTNLGTVAIEQNDFNSRNGSGVQEATIYGPLLTAIQAAKGSFQQNLGVTPYGQVGSFSSGSFTGNVNLANGAQLQFTDASGGTPYFVAQGDNNFVLYLTGSSGAPRPIFSAPMHSDLGQVSFAVDVNTPFITSGSFASNATVASGQSAFDARGVTQTSGGNVVWLADEQRIALSSDGTHTISYDVVSGGILLGGPVHFTAAPVLPAYAVAALPAVPLPGSKAYASDGRKVGEGAGSGTGVEVFADKTAHWISVLSGMPVQA